MVMSMSSSRKKCPAYGKTCKKCHQENHFAQCCPPQFRKKSYAVDNQYASNDSDSDGEQYFPDDRELVMVIDYFAHCDTSTPVSQEVNQVYTLSDKQKEEGPLYAEMD